MLFSVVSFHMVILIFPENTMKESSPRSPSNTIKGFPLSAKLTASSSGASLACSRKSLADFSVSSSLTPVSLPTEHWQLAAWDARNSVPTAVKSKAGESDEWDLKWHLCNEDIFRQTGLPLTSLAARHQL